MAKTRKKTKVTAQLDDHHGSRGSHKIGPQGGRYRDLGATNSQGCGRTHINRTTKK